MCSDEDHYIPIEDAVEAVRNDVPSLMQLIRDKVEAIIKTRTELDSLLKRVDQEKVRLHTSPPLQCVFCSPLKGVCNDVFT